MVRLSTHRISEGERKHSSERQLLASSSLTHSLYVYITLSPSIYTSPSSISDDFESVATHFRYHRADFMIHGFARPGLVFMSLNEQLLKTLKTHLHVEPILESLIGQFTCRMSDTLTFGKLILVVETLSSKLSQCLLCTYRVKHLRVDPSVVLCGQYLKLMTHNLYNMMQWSLLLRPLLFSDYLSFKTIFSCTEF